MTKTIYGTGLIVLAAMLPVHAGNAQDAQVPTPPEEFAQVQQCMPIADPTQRLACYDAQMAALATAVDQGEVVIADREQIREAKRGIFGLSLPSLRLFSAKDEEEITEIESTISSLSRVDGGKWLFVLEDGAQWVQTDTRPLWPKSGNSIRIRQAAMGSYLANVNGGIAVRVRRLAN